jgi:hypothetical protein
MCTTHCLEWRYEPAGGSKRKSIRMAIKMAIILVQEEVIGDGR